MRRAAKIDANQTELVEAFRRLGCSVLSLAAVGKGVPDLLVATRGITWLVEVKMPKGRETADQIAFISGWKGCRALVRDLDGVLTVVRSLQEQSDRLRPPV
jgi:hypothetical protein